jgi:hypothetical protein
MITFKLFVEKQKGLDGKACWDGYARRGTKKKGDKTVDNCVKVGEEVVGRAKPKADRTRLSDEFKQQLLDHGMNMYQQHGASFPEIKETLMAAAMGRIGPEKAHPVAMYLQSDEFANSLEAKLDAYDEEMYGEKNAQCTGPTKKASSTSKGKKWMKCVKSDSGGYKRIHWGQKGVKVSGKANTKRRKSFRARHKCSTAKANTPRGQACKDW